MSAHEPGLLYMYVLFVSPCCDQSLPPTPSPTPQPCHFPFPTYQGNDYPAIPQLLVNLHTHICSTYMYIPQTHTAYIYAIPSIRYPLLPWVDFSLTISLLMFFSGTGIPFPFPMEPVGTGCRR